VGAVLTVVANILVGLIALLHVYILVLEMFLWTTPRGLRAFEQTLERARSTATLAANQGLYNGFLAAGLFWGLVESTPDTAFAAKVFFLGCVIVAGVYGGVTVGIRIALIQALPAAVALVLLLLG
jgi:putative membrane protein